jgi:hypothetical protein
MKKVISQEHLQHEYVIFWPAKIRIHDEKRLITVSEYNQITALNRPVFLPALAQIKPVKR